ncbi:hypothetical protein D5S17_12035 [Pseudonocardiaceae bacterium YIM PH 21723]|nr:hypothetical protein D5S17_12035 [Pseudonocardiaceae bacterium YIM PH 21723]
MLSDLQIQNIDRSFNLWDHDGSGGIERSDVDRVSFGIVRSCGRDEESAEATALVAAYLEIFTFIIDAADKNQDQVVTRQEYRDAHEANQDFASELLTRWDLVCDAIFAVADRDGDGRLGLEDVVDIYAGLETPRQVAVDGFPNLDLDGDGYIDGNEWRQAIRGVFTADDESARGAAMFKGV